MEPNNGNRSYNNYNNSGSGSNPNSMSNYPNDMSGAMSSDYGNSTNSRQHHNYDPRFYADAQDHDPNIDALLPPLKQIDINQIPPDVLGHLLKTKRIDHLVATTAQRPPPQQQQQHQYTQSNYNNYPSPPQKQQQQQHHHQQQQQSYQGGNPNQSPNPNPLYRNTGSSNTSPATQYPNDWHPGSSSGSNSNTSSPASYGNTSRSSPRSNVPSNPSTFSPMAKEFVPRTYRSPRPQHQQPRQPRHQQQQQQQQSWNVGVYDPSTSWNQSGPSSNEFELDSADSVLENITDTITRLTMNPADFQRCSNKTVEILKKYLSDVDTLGIVVTLIFEQSISNPNFCYSGARLCQVLNRSNITVGNQTFKDQLLLRCQEEFANCLENVKDPQTEKRALGLTMFLAELYLNFRIETQGVSAKINILGAAAAELMTVIAKRPPSVDNIKCIFQTLKLAGWDLYHETHEKVKTQMMQLFQQLSLIGMSYKGKLEPRVEYLLESIFKLKDNDWNKAETAPSEESSSSIPNPYKTAEGEDAAQAESQFYELPDNVEDDDFNLLIDDEPEDVRKAYEEFLASQNS